MNQAQNTSKIIENFLYNIISFFPQIIAGTIILIIGVIIGNIVSRLFLGLFRVFNPEKTFKDNKIIKTVSIKAWLLLLSQIVRWTIIIIFLVAAFEAWGIKEVSKLLNQFLMYLPNVVIAVFISFIGVVVAGIVQDLVKNSAKGLGASMIGSLSTIAYYSIIVFTVLLVLSQLGVAADLIKILFTGLVAMFAISGGLAFGLGGQETAKKILEAIYNKFRNN